MAAKKRPLSPVQTPPFVYNLDFQSSIACVFQTQTENNLEQVMFNLIKEFRKKLEWTQEQFATEAGIDQSQVSRLESSSLGKKFSELCNDIRTVARKKPRVWLEILADFDGGLGYSEFEDLFFITEKMSINDFKELWVISDSPIETVRTAVRRQLTEYLINNSDVHITYWSSDDSLDNLWLLSHNMQADGLPLHALENQLQVIVSPPFMTMLPIGLIDPRTDNTLGFLSPRLITGDASRLVVLPKSTSKHLSCKLEQIFAKFEDLDIGKNEIAFQGSNWKKIPFNELAKCK